MSLTATVEALVEAGASPEMILAVVRRHEVERERAAQARREKDAARQRSKRDRDHAESRDVTRTDRDTDGPSPRACVVNTSLPSLRSEELTSLANANSVGAVEKSGPKPKPEPKPPKSRGSRLPDDWELSEADVEVARAEGLTDEEIHRAALEFRNYWTSRTGSAATKLSWPRTWHNRVLEIADRNRRNGPRLVAATGQSGGGRRGPVSFADLYTRRHGGVAD